MISFKKAQFVISAPSLKERPRDGKPAVLLVGRSNVGKSTLINSLCSQKIAFSSKKAGKTKLLNYFLIDDSFYLVDAPGWGSTLFANLTTINFAEMMEDYMKEDSLKAILLILDLRHEPAKDDASFLGYLRKSGVPLIYVLSKADLMNQKERAQAEKYAVSLGIKNPIFSYNNPDSAAKIRSEISHAIS